MSDELASVFRQSSLGLPRGEVRLVDSDRTWPMIFERLTAEILALRPESVVAVEHIGSTAVPGLAAKPILDIAVGVRAGDDPDPATGALQRLGFLLRGDVPGLHLNRNLGFELESRVRLVNAHLVTHGGPEWTAYLRFRDRLRAEPAARDNYQRVKQDLARAHPTNRGSYIEGKTELVRGLAERR